MKWLKRGAWLFVWSGWACLGAGLYHQLPRELGAAAAELPQGTRLGFIGDSNRFVTMRVKPQKPWGSDIIVCDASTGEIERKVDGPVFGVYLRPFRGRLLQHGLFITELPNAEFSQWTPGLFRLDFDDGQWHCLVDRRIAAASLHESKPWVVVVEAPERPGAPDRVVVIDWESGRKTVVRERDIGSQADGTPFFISNSDRVAIPLLTPKDQREAICGLEIWNVGDPPALEKRLERIAFGGQLVTSSPGGRVAFEDFRSPSLFSVLDLNLGKAVFPTGREEKLPRGPTRLVEPALSRSGQRVLGGNPMALWDLERGKALWVGSASEIPNAETGDDVFSVSEEWGWLWKWWLPKHQYTTCALRSMETGALILRTSSPLKISRMILNEDRTLVVADSAAYRLPLPMNWVLLGLCQFVLAMPMVLVWGVMRLRRRRRVARSAA